MRRGHLGIGGWRSENTRHFRPRGGGNAHYRPRGYSLLDAPRFPPPTPRSQRPPYVSRPSHSIDQNDEQSRNNYRFDNRKNQGRPYEKHNDRQMYPQLQCFRHSEVISHMSTYKEPHYYDKPNQSDGSYVNRHGDVDHRQSNAAQSHLSFQKPIPTSWVLPVDHKAHLYDDRNLNKSYRHYDDVNKMPLHDYPGHRPPSSDHYGGNPKPTIDTSNTFSRSVDDTVNIVRKRLLNRNESLQTTDCMSTDSSNPDMHRDNLVNRYNDIQQEPPARRQVQKQVLKKKSNCDKIKNKIVHQLFKMDKEKIHKLMDNPNSSTKFEYAINSLITESQNSFNRHLRSVAEKSLCISSTDFMDNDNNTIYEDTFLKQMQCLLDPQDTVFLEDIKPIVMAELTKVLQLDDIEQHSAEDENNHYSDTHLNYNECDTTYNNYENYREDYTDNIYSEEQLLKPDFQESSLKAKTNESYGLCDTDQLNNVTHAKPLFERRQRTKSCTYSEEQVTSSENARYARLSLDNQSSNDIYKNIDDSSALFGASTEHLSEDEDPFAELDNQYHVAVDHNLISMEDTCSLQQSVKDNNNSSITAGINVTTVNQTPEKEHILKQEVDTQILDIAKSPLELSLNLHKNTDPNVLENTNAHNKQQSLHQFENINMINTTNSNEISVIIDNRCLEPDKSSNSCGIPKTLTTFNSRKRHIDQQTPHRKEKRKKIESTPPDLTQKDIIKNDVLNTSINILKIPEKCNVVNPRSDIETRLKEISKETKKLGTDDKEYSDKYVKRKNNQNKPKEKINGPKKICNPNSSNHSQENNKNDTISNISQNPTKVPEGKTTLKTIDMFIEKPKKLNIHQSHRNTAVVPSTSSFTSLDKIRKKWGSKRRRKGLKRHIATQVFKRFLTKETQTVNNISICTKFSQTEKSMLCTQAVQTEPMLNVKQVANSSDTLERMKEIDLEIQVLLQEKFKLYSSLENKEASQNSLQTLGMTVLNVTPFEDSGKIEGTDGDSLSGDAIVDDFTNIPVEELEQIAFESVHTDSNESFNFGKRSRRQVVLDQERRGSVSPRTNKKNNKKSKTPNISLIEQIITEEIIALDELEKPVKTRSKTQKVQNTRKRGNKKTKSTKTINCDVIDEANIFEIKECSVVLVREDLNKLLLQNTFENYEYQESLYEPEEYSNYVNEVEIVAKDSAEINDVQFDMLDVSEDIVIGDNCEIKSIQDKELETIEISINEEIILDNSKSSEEILAPQTTSGDSECKMYDYSADENLCRDTITVTGNGDAVLAIECIENNFIAACLDGNVYYFSSDGQLINTLRGSNFAVTCLTIVKEKYGTTVYTGSLDSRIRYYDLETGIEKGPECNVLSPIQTMDRAWDTVFVGTRTGFVLQFECKNNMLIPVSTVKFSDQSILALRAMKEGPRKVLLVAARSENVTIKDAQTGLLLRTLSGPKMTVYTLLYEDGKVYCGTSSPQIQVFDYTSGTHVGAHEGGKGAVCLRASGGLLFAGCYDGCVYVYREGGARPMAQLRGPGLMLLSLAVVGSKIIAGYKDRSLYIWKIPLSILQEMIL